MQNIVNYLVPFYNEDGMPVSAGRVHFVKKGTSATKFEDITSQDYITIKDKSGTVIENPLPLNSVGAFSIQPFVDEGVDFKMIVDEPTGYSVNVALGMVDDSAEWRTISVIDSRANKVDLTIEGMSYVDSLVELRTLSTEVKCAVVLGYAEKEDFCPARIFKWTKKPYAENYGTHIKSSVDSTGVWVCEPNDFLDLRWFGVNPNDTSKTDYSSSILQASLAYPRLPVYFAGGVYYISLNMDFSSVILDKNSFIRPYAGIVQMVIGHLENRGGKFVAEGNALDSAKVIPVVKGEFRSSLVSGNLCSFVFATTMGMSNIFRDCDIIVLDSFTDDDSFLDYSAIAQKAQYLSGKTIIVNGGATPLWIKYAGKNCVIVNGYDKSVSVGNVDAKSVGTSRISVGDFTIVPYNDSTRISKNGNIIATISESGISFGNADVGKLNVTNFIPPCIARSENFDLYDIEEGYKAGAIVAVKNNKSLGIKVYVGTRQATEGKVDYVNVGAGMVYLFRCEIAKDTSTIIPTNFYRWVPIGNYIVNQEDA